MEMVYLVIHDPTGSLLRGSAGHSAMKPAACPAWPGIPCPDKPLPGLRTATALGWKLRIQVIKYHGQGHGWQGGETHGQIAGEGRLRRGTAQHRGGLANIFLAAGKGFADGSLGRIAEPAAKGSTSLKVL